MAPSAAAFATRSRGLYGALAVVVAYLLLRGDSPSWRELTRHADAEWCNVETIDAHSFQPVELAERLASATAPVLVRGLEWRGITAWADREAFLEAHGDLPVSIGGGVALGVSGPEDGLPGAHATPKPGFERLMRSTDLATDAASEPS